MFVRGQSFSVKIFDRARSSRQVIGNRRGGGGDIFIGLSGRRFLSPRVSPLRVFLSCAQLTHSSACYAGYITSYKNPVIWQDSANFQRALILF